MKNKKYLFQSKGMTSFLIYGQWTTDKNERKYRHMSIIPFPVCAYEQVFWDFIILVSEIQA